MSRSVLSVDPGTYTLISATRGETGNEVKCKREINAFLKIPLENKFTFNALKASGKVKLVERAGMGYAIGESAVNLAYTLGAELSRPMRKGVLNPQESEAFEILKAMLHSLIGEIKGDKGLVYYSVPADAVNEKTNAAFHSQVLKDIFSAYNFKEKRLEAYPINEALALVFAELADKNFSGVGISCLVPGTKIYTRRGIVNIENVVAGDEVITHKGRWRKVNNVVKQEHKGIATKLQITGYSDNTNMYKFVKNHELYVYRDGDWKWVGCDEVLRGDIVGEPIIKRDREKSKPVINWIERKTCSKKKIKKTIKCSSNIARLIGYFLTDGHINSREDGDSVNFDFGTNEKQYCDDVCDIALKCFSKKAAIVECNDNKLRVKIYSNGISSWFKNHCYNKFGEKTVPWCISRLTHTECVNLLVGLIRGDGWITDGMIGFGNTTTSLCILVKQLFSRLGHPSTISTRGPRYNEKYDIQGTKDEWTVSSSKKTISHSIVELIETINCKTSTMCEKVWVEDNFCCATIQKVEQEKYSGLVYDLQVEEDHSFSGPFLTIHNCGGGMRNACVAMYGQPALQFSVVNSGDWIDEQSARAANVPVVVVNQEKTKLDLNKSPTTPLDRALHASYRILIDDTITHLKDQLSKANLKIRPENPFDIVIAGGVVSPPGFEHLVRESVKSVNLPIPIGDIIKPEDNHFAVARGCLAAAEMSQ